MMAPMRLFHRVADVAGESDDRRSVGDAKAEAADVLVRIPMPKVKM